ncbi:MAG: iron-siderophore ABC transporter substrate-binding protein [Cyanobacteria bacterium P01_D01_bin.73]
MGTTEVPATPKRVVVLDTAPLDGAIALGITPVGTIRYGDPPAYLGDKIADIKVIGQGNQPNLEAILQLQPDLILGSKIGVSRDFYEKLSQIAPTVLTVGSGRDGEWRDNLRLYAEALGQAKAAEELLQTYRRRVRQFSDALAPSKATRLSVLFTYSNQIGAYTTQSFAGSVLRDLGMARTEEQEATHRYALLLSAEALEALDGDHIFLIHSAGAKGSLPKADFVRHPIWSQLTAVQQNRICEVSGQVWAAGRSILAAQQILADVERCLQD